MKVPPQRWLVQLTGDNICVMTARELDFAYELGFVNNSTLVLSETERQWFPLGELLRPEDRGANS
jgi:hypothetical protein